MRLPSAPEKYSREDQDRVRTAVEREIEKTFRNDRETAPVRLVLTAPNGTRWLIGVSNLGVLTTTAL